MSAAESILKYQILFNNKVFYFQKKKGLHIQLDIRRLAVFFLQKEQ